MEEDGKDVDDINVKGESSQDVGLEVKLVHGGLSSNDQLYVVHQEQGEDHYSDQAVDELHVKKLLVFDARL